MSNTNLIKRMEALSAAYKAQFDNPPEIPLKWDIRLDMLRVDGIEVCPVSDLAPTGEAAWADCLCLPLMDGRMDIQIEWKYGEVRARIYRVSVTRNIYLVDDEDEDLTPGNGGKDCLYNGEHAGYECACDECDHLQACFPKHC